MRRWRPKEKSKLPAPNDEYLGFETARAWGYTLSEWMQESEYLRAKAMAHYLHCKMREGYETEQAMKGTSGSGSSSSDGIGKLDAMMRAMNRGFSVSSPGVEFQKGSNP